MLLAAPVWAEAAVVRAVLFYSPSCGHCHKVITEDLPPLFEKYGEQLQLLGVDVTQPEGQALFQAAIQQFNIPPDGVGVPMLIVADVVLVGSLNIPQQFPGLIEKYLAQGGVAWPDIPGLSGALAATPATPDVMEPAASPEPLAATPETRAGLIVNPAPSASLGEKLARDPLGNGLAIVVLLAMILSVGGVIVRGRSASPMQSSWMVPALVVIGLGVAGYLAYVETAQVAAVCGPVGDCNTVQQSEYARLFGLIPIGVLGLIGYLAIGLAWAVGRYGRGLPADWAARALVGLTLVGTLFSIYLTFLEPFVIGATCAWCLTSAVIMTALLWLTAAPPRLSALRR
jgi:uncharacterized membrane protein